MQGSLDHGNETAVNPDVVEAACDLSREEQPANSKALEARREQVVDGEPISSTVSVLHKVTVAPVRKLSPEIAMHCHYERKEFNEIIDIAFREYGRELYTYIVGVLGQQDADDANGDLWEGAFRGITAFRWESSLRTWLYRIAWCSCSRFLRSRHRDRARMGADPSELLSLPAPVPCVETQLYVESTIEDQIARIRDKLDPEDRILLVLRVERGLPWTEIAAILFSTGDLRSTAILRKRYERIKDKIRIQARAVGLLGNNDDS